jgi:hypothetical protein
MIRHICCAAALVAGTAAAASPPFQQVPAPGVRHYRYTVVQTINRTTQRGYRADFDLEADRDGNVDAIMLSSEALADGSWTAVSVDPACRTAMHGDAASLARVRLWPLPPAVAADLGGGFLDTCAPGGIFFPLTDILNAVLIPLSPHFRVDALRRQGQTVHFPGFSTAYNRAGEGFREATDGGNVRLTRLDRTHAVIDWLPLPARLDLDQRNGATSVRLHGTEHWAFRLTLDRRTGAIVGAHTLYDDLDLAVVNVPGAPHVTIRRAVTIVRR